MGRRGESFNSALVRETRTRAEKFLNPIETFASNAMVRVSRTMALENNLNPCGR